MRHAVFAPSSIVLNAVGRRFTVRYTDLKGGGLELVQSTHSDIEVSGNVGNGKGCLALLRLWLQMQGRVYLIPWAEQISCQTGLAFKAIQIRGQKTRWGSCSSKGTISLNYKLLFLRSHLVTYIIIHELCHTVHMNHSLNFRSFLATLEPEWKKLDAELKGASRLVPRWVNR